MGVSAQTPGDESDGCDPLRIARALGISVEELRAFAKKLGILFGNGRLEVGEVGVIKAAFRYRGLTEDEVLTVLEEAERKKAAKRKSKDEH